MIRPLQPDDTEELMALCSATGLFDPGGIDELRKALTEYFGGSSDSEHCWITDDDGLPGVA